MIAAIIGGIGAWFLAPSMITALGAMQAAKAQKQQAKAEAVLKD